MSMSISSSLSSNLFTKLDTKQQGYIDKSELQEAFSKISGGDADTSSTDALFSKLDGDGDGKITESELSDGMQSLGEALQSQLKQSQMGGMGMPPPPPADDGSDAGMTKDEITALANDSSTDSTGQAMLTALAENFEAADTNENGKVSATEAMQYDQSQTSASGVADSGNAMEEQLELMTQLMELIQAYGGSSDSASSTSSLLSAVA